MLNQIGNIFELSSMEEAKCKEFEAFFDKSSIADIFRKIILDQEFKIWIEEVWYPNLPESER